MSEELKKSVQEMLNEEKWTRATISNYSKSNFIEFATKVEEVQKAGCIDEIKEICDEHLSHSKNSIIGLYLSGMLGLKKHEIDNPAIVDLVTIFQDNHKTQIVEYLCECILQEDETNKFALRTLADCYKSDNNEGIWEIYERIVRLDIEEADIAKLLAEHYESLGMMEEAVDFYKKALLRFVAKGSNNQIKEIWTKLVSLIPEEIEFFYLVQRKIAKNISEDKSAVLMQEIYAYYKENKRWDTCIDILKLLLKIDEKDQWARKEIVECFRGKYEKHSQLEECIKVSGIDTNWRGVFDAINDFEKHIAFDTKNFVFHRTWGVGVIRKVSKEKIEVYFGKKIGTKEMTLKMAIEALQPLAKDHIWVLKATKSKEELVEKVKNDNVWALKTIIKSFDNNCDFKRIKAELVPSILTPSEWTNWSTKARKKLEEDSTFGVNPNDISLYTVRDHEISIEEKLANEFKAQKNFFSRIDILMKFEKSADTESELFADMFNYFFGYLKSFTTVNEQVLASFLVVRKVMTEQPQLNQPLPTTFAKIFNQIENPEEMYLALKDTANTSLKKDCLSCIRTLLPNWNEIYIKLFPTVLQKSMIDTLINSGYKKDVQALALHSFEDYKNYREAAVFFFKECQDEEWFKEINFSYEKQLITMVHIIDLTYREIDNHCNTTENKKINKQIQTLLFKNDTVLDYIFSRDEETVTRIYTLIEDVNDLDQVVKNRMRNKILEKYPDFKFYGAKESTTTPKGLMVTQKMYNIKKELLDRLLNVELPENAKEIGEAKEKGDLRENAEYKAALEKQGHLNSQINHLQSDIAKAVIFDPNSVTTAKISFGTTVLLKNNETSSEEEFTILGPWESDPKAGIISYLAPLGNALLDAKEGEDLNFKIGDKDRSYKVLKIKIAKF